MARRVSFTEKEIDIPSPGEGLNDESIEGIQGGAGQGLQFRFDTKYSNDDDGKDKDKDHDHDYESSSAFLPSPPPSPGKPQRRKSALKPNGEKDLPPVPHHVFTHPDPLIRRLRLRDNEGNLVDLEKEFRDSIVVGFLFGASWSGPDKSYYKDVLEFARHHPHQFKLIYVSVDENKESYSNNAFGHGWLSMEWDDGSNVANIFDETNSNPSLQATTAREELAENFIHGQDPHAEVLATLPPNVYTRPLSRVHLASKLGVLSIPTLAVYHIPSAKWIEAYVRPRDIRSDKRDSSFEQWSRGQSVMTSMADVLHQLRWTLVFATFGLVYALSVYFGGSEYDFIGKFVHEYLGQSSTTPTKAEF